MYKENDNLDYENIEKSMKLPPEELDRLIEEEKGKIKNSELVKEDQQALRKQQGPFLCYNGSGKMKTFKSQGKR